MSGYPSLPPVDDDSVADDNASDNQYVPKHYVPFQYSNSLHSLVDNLKHCAVQSVQCAVAYAVCFSSFADFLKNPELDYPGYVLKLDPGFFEEYMSWVDDYDDDEELPLSQLDLYPEFGLCVYLAFRYNLPWTEALCTFVGQSTMFRDVYCLNFFNRERWLALLHEWDYCGYFIEPILYEGLFEFAKRIFQLEFAKHVDISIMVIKHARELYPDGGRRLYVPPQLFPEVGYLAHFRTPLGIPLEKVSLEKRMALYEPFKLFRLSLPPPSREA